jgi:hypothetical protein
MLVKRRCFCNNCGTEFRFQDDIWNDDNCPVCGNDDPDYELITIPDYETPEQYEKRTGEKYSDTGQVWCKIKGRKEYWPFRLSEVQTNDVDGKILIADPPFPPPDDWKPKELQDERN